MAERNDLENIVEINQIQIIRDIEKTSNNSYIEKIYAVIGNERMVIAARSDITNGELIFSESAMVNLEKWDVTKAQIQQSLEERDKILKVALQSIGIEENEIEFALERELMARAVRNSKDNEKKKMEENDKQELEKDKNERDKNEDDNENKPVQISKEQSQRINSLNEIDLNGMASEYETLRNALKLHEYEKLIVVHSDEISKFTDKDGNQGKSEKPKLSFLGKKADGTYEVIPNEKLRMYRGDNLETTTIKNEDQAKVNDDFRDYMFEAPGTGYKMGIKPGQYGIAETYLVKSEHDNTGNVGIKMQDDKYDGRDRTNVEMRQLYNAKGEYQIDEMGKEAATHNNNCQIKMEEVDGVMETGHLHEDSVIVIDRREGKFDMLAKTLGGCTSEQEITEFLKSVNEKLDAGFKVEQAFEQVKNERIVEPEKMLMDTYNIDQTQAKNVLERHEGNIEEAMQDLEEQRQKGVLEE